MSAQNQQYLQEYVDIFCKACNLYLNMKKNKDVTPKQMQEIKTIYQYSYMGMLREGYEGTIVNKNGEDYICFKVSLDGEKEKELTFKLDNVKAGLGEDFDEVISRMRKESTETQPVETQAAADSLMDFMNEQPQQEFETEPTVDEEPVKEEPVNEIEEEVKPASIQEGDTKDKNTFCYEEYNVVAQSIENGTIRNISLFIYPDAIPATREDKVQTIGIAREHGENKNVMAISKAGGSAVLTLGNNLQLMVKFKPGKNNNFDGDVYVIKGQDRYDVEINRVTKINTVYGYNGHSHFIHTFKGKEIHIFPLNFNDNDLEGCVSVTAYAGEEKQIICPHETKYLPVSINDMRYNLQLYWRGDILYCEQVD